MDWLSDNWLWIVVVILFYSYAMHMGPGHRGDGSDGEHGAQGGRDREPP